MAPLIGFQLGVQILDLNLIRAFASVMEEGSVTAAAEKLNLSQPSVTQALQRLQKAAGEELFRRSGRGIAPTRAAQQLYREIGRFPALVDAAVVGLTSFDPSRARVTFRMALTDLGQTVFLPVLASALSEAAPRCSLDVLNLDTDTVVDDLSAGWLDLAVSSTPLGGALRSKVVRPDVYCCVSRRGRFSGRQPDLAEMTSVPRVVVRDSTGHTLVESVLPPPVEGSLHLSGFAAIPAIVAASQLLAFVPEAVTADWLARWDLEIRPLPREEFSVAVRAHIAVDAKSAATRWFTTWAIETMRGLPRAQPLNRLD